MEIPVKRCSISIPRICHHKIYTSNRDEVECDKENETNAASNDDNNEDDDSSDGSEETNIEMETSSARLTRLKKARKRNLQESSTPRKQKKTKKYAETTLPDDLQINKSSIPNAGRGVFAKKDICSGRRFGPFEGKRREKLETESSEKAAYTWEIFENGKVKHCIDGSDENRSNWLRYINCARNEVEQNLYAFQCGENIFYRTKKPISAGSELLVWCGEQYGEDLGIDVADEEEVSHGFSCKACATTFSTRFRLYTHLKYCRKKYENQLIHPSADPSRSIFGNFRKIPRPNKCSICDYPQNQLKRLDVHILSEHPEAETFTCEFCGKVFALQLSHYFHRLSHFNGGSLNCPLCGKFVKIRSKLFDHIGTHSGGRLFFCNGCGQITTHDRIEQVLTQDNSSDNPIAYSCDYCAKDYTLEELYATHYGAYDSFTRQHQCEECGQRFKMKYLLRIHMETHAESRRRFECLTCKKSYSTQCSLRNHEKFCNGEMKKEYPCEQCDKIYRSYSGLQKHYLIHAGVKPFVCNVCGKAFRVDTQLQMHKRVHTGEKPHTCDICNQSFSQSCSLTRHRRIHTGEKPYKCKLCDEGFRQGSLLKNHMRRYHQGETDKEEK